MYKWVTPFENVSSGTRGQRMARSACVFTKSHQDLHCPLIESSDTIKCINGCPDESLRMRGMNLNLCILHMLEDTLSHGAANKLNCIMRQLGVQ